MKGFHWLICFIAGLTRDTVTKVLTAEVQVGAALAEAELYARGEEYATEFERAGQPHLAAAIRAEFKRLRAEAAAASVPPTSPHAPPMAAPSSALPPSPPPDALPARKKPGRKPALKPAPETSPPFAPSPKSPW